MKAILSKRFFYLIILQKIGLVAVVIAHKGSLQISGLYGKGKYNVEKMTVYTNYNYYYKNSLQIYNCK